MAAQGGIRSVQVPCVLMSLVSHSLSARETISVVHITVCIGYSGILDIMIPKSKDSDATCMISLVVIYWL